MDRNTSTATWITISTFEKAITDRCLPEERLRRHSGRNSADRPCTTLGATKLPAGGGEVPSL